MRKWTSQLNRCTEKLEMMGQMICWGSRRNNTVERSVERERERELGENRLGEGPVKLIKNKEAFPGHKNVSLQLFVLIYGDEISLGEKENSDMDDCCAVDRLINFIAKIGQIMCCIEKVQSSMDAIGSTNYARTWQCKLRQMKKSS